MRTPTSKRHRHTFDFAHGQMYTGTVRGNRELERVWAEEVSPARGRTPITSVRLPVDIEARLDARAVTEDRNDEKAPGSRR